MIWCNLTCKNFTIHMTHFNEFWYKTAFSNIGGFAVTLNRTHLIWKSSVLDRFTLNIWKTPKCVSQHEVYILQVPQDVEYTELLFIMTKRERERWLNDDCYLWKTFFLDTRINYKFYKIISSVFRVTYEHSNEVFVICKQ